MTLPPAFPSPLALMVCVKVIGLRDLLAFEQQMQREEQDKEAERLAKAAAKAARPPRVISGYGRPVTMRHRLRRGQGHREDRQIPGSARGHDLRS